MKNLLLLLTLFTFVIGFSHTPITNGNFDVAIADCLATHPVTGLCLDSKYGPMPSGDIGAFSKEYKKRDHIIGYAYFKENNITYIATGIGGGVRDNILIVDIYEDKSVKLNLVHLNGDNINSLGKLKH